MYIGRCFSTCGEAYSTDVNLATTTIWHRTWVRHNIPDAFLQTDIHDPTPSELHIHNTASTWTAARANQHRQESANKSRQTMKQTADSRTAGVNNHNCDYVPAAITSINWKNALDRRSRSDRPRHNAHARWPRPRHAARLAALACS